MFWVYHSHQHTRTVDNQMYFISIPLTQPHKVWMILLTKLKVDEMILNGKFDYFDYFDTFLNYILTNRG